MPDTFVRMVLEHADDNGQITWREASLLACAHRVWSDFAAEYGCMIGEGIDAGELLAWLGY